MQILTLIPNAKNYGITTLMLLIIGSFTIARHIHVRWLKDQCSLITANALIKSVIALIGLFIVPIVSLFDMNIENEFMGLIVGILFGLATIQIEHNLLRKTNRKYLIKKKLVNHVNDQTIFLNPKINTKMSLSTIHSFPKGMTSIRQNQLANKLSAFTGYSLSAVISVAIAEEWLFRGYCYAIAQQFKNPWLMFSLLILSLFIFAFSHISTSWREGANKLPLAILSLLAMLITGTLTAAITTHVMVNINAWRQMKSWQRNQTEMQTC